MSIFSTSTFMHDVADKYAYNYPPTLTELPQNAEDQAFKLILPPINATGTMHLGHSLTITIEDMMARYHKLRGDKVVWIPGVDHAGIATQVVVEKQLMRDTKQSRHDLGREKFLEKVWEWKEKNCKSIKHQLQTMSSLINYELEQFTMSPELSAGVIDAFVELYNKGLIYRDLRMVDFCCNLKTVISNIEVDEIEIEVPQKYTLPDGFKVDLGYMYEIKYLIDESSLNETQRKLIELGERQPFVIVSTTRPETLFGDVAVAVNPKDERYLGLEGVQLVLPLTSRKIPLIYDDQAKMEMGTGAVKITPAHDPKDYQCWLRCKALCGLPDPIEVIDDDGLMNVPDSIEFHQKKRYLCRKLVLKQLSDSKLLVDTKPHKTTVRVCSRSGDILEPRLKHQWYVDTDDMSKRSIEAVEKGDLKIIPDPDGVHRATWHRFLSEGRSWCISRQLWWGHRVPAYRIVPKEGFSDVIDTKASEKWIVAKNFTEAKRLAEEKFRNTDLENNYNLVQDEDVLDTWFSSGLYPFTIEGGKYFPLDVLETGKDILFFWVARMVMLSLALKDTLPFKTVYLHNVVRDKDGKKMSKSLGNIIDPLDIVYGITRQAMEDRIKNSNLDEKEISRAVQNIKKNFPNGISDYGVDSLRMGLVSYLKQGTDINLDPTVFKTAHALLNKLWNVMVMYELYDGKHKERKESDNMSDNARDKNVDDLIEYMKTLERRFLDWTLYENNDFALIYENIQQYVMNHFCPFYLEFIKYYLMNPKYEGSRTVATIMNHFFRLFSRVLTYLHPIAPNATTAMHARLNSKFGDDVRFREITSIDYVEESADGNSDATLNIVTTFDALRETLHLINSGKGSIDSLNTGKVNLDNYRDVIKFMAKT
ncbi:hypothetical protein YASMINEVIRUS_51 [Yasminevirus sp. GU-2018]|uniref:valine--tRNA ligase n=1 Tax=Yasminevirus sp. GU-2018 TaxID=2420051 RepID=A0A5K0U6N0_9VIRU|nr:hypothetical protein YASMINEVIRUS_51 [Yasminevirus sp. GU-2018]